MDENTDSEMGTRDDRRINDQEGGLPEQSLTYLEEITVNPAEKEVKFQTDPKEI